MRRVNAVNIQRLNDRYWIDHKLKISVWYDVNILKVCASHIIHNDIHKTLLLCVDEIQVLQFDF